MINGHTTNNPKKKLKEEEIYGIGDSVFPIKENSAGEDDITLAGKSKPHKNHSIIADPRKTKKLCFSSVSLIVIDSF